MPGLYSLRTDGTLFFKRGFLLIAVPVAALLFQACSSSGEGTAESKRAFEESLLRHEAGFDPSEYNREINSVVAEEISRQRTEEIPVEVSNPPPADLVQGFRVQLLASTSIDEASSQKKNAEEIFPEEWFYLVYDPPTYRIRGGNFRTRFEADQFLRVVRDSGYNDAWIVPDRIQKNPVPRSTPSPPDQEQP